VIDDTFCIIIDGTTRLTSRETKNSIGFSTVVFTGISWIISSKNVIDNKLERFRFA
jgi:hypothetical protein